MGKKSIEKRIYEKGQVPEHLVIKDWCRPFLKETLKLSEGMIEHILNVGLILEK